jgi:hypothetical protein
MKTFRDWTTLTQNHFSFGSVHHRFRQRFMDRDDYQNILAAIRSFVQRPWFKRAWCFQEIVLSRDAQFLCGNSELDFKSFRLAYGVAGASCAVGECFSSNPSVEVISNSWLLKRDDKQRLSLAYLLRKTKGLSATDPRDKIFALLGLADVHFSELFVPSYSISVPETYVSCT